MILLLTLACTAPLPDDSAETEAPSTSGGVEYYVWDYVCTGSARLESDAPFMPPSGRDPLLVSHMANHDTDVWRSYGDVEWREGIDTTSGIESACQEGTRGRITIAYRADE
jgi:hypothetical protein